MVFAVDGAGEILVVTLRPAWLPHVRWELVNKYKILLLGDAFYFIPTNYSPVHVPPLTFQETD